MSEGERIRDVRRELLREPVVGCTIAGAHFHHDGQCGGQRWITHGTSRRYGFNPRANSEILDAARIAETLDLNPDAFVEMRCFNLEEVEAIKRNLKPSHQARVRWKWLDFLPSGEPGEHRVEEPGG
jgi:hypothetical protein